MKCPYCAEEIQDMAVLCRFCGARRIEGVFRAPPHPPQAAKSNFTIVSTGWLLLLSGVWSVVTLSAPVVLFGGERSGPVAVLYNAAFAAALSAMGFSLVRRKPWALWATLAASLMYTVDKLELILDDKAQRAALEDLGSSLGELAPMVQQVRVLVGVLFLLGWWSFALYVYVKRDYFRGAL